MGERQKPGAALKTKPDELVLEKFFLDYITVWYRERIVTANQYDKARKEIDLLKDKKKTKEKKKNSKPGEDIDTGKDCPCNYQREGVDSERSRSGRSKEVSATQKSRPKPVASDKNRNDGTQHRQELQSLRQQNEDLEQKIYSLKEKISVLRANAHYELTEKDGQIEKLRKLLETSRLQNDDLSKRLSKLAGDKLRQGNPDLADLSDRYRPTEVGKMFSEVYDNEWSDAFENIPNMDEDKKVGTLHGIVMKAFQFCEEKFNEQTDMVLTTLLGLQQDFEEKKPDKETKRIRANIQNVLKDVRKEVALETAGNVAKEFNTTLRQFVSVFKNQPEVINKPLSKFANKCIELCWLMVLCDPPMTLSDDKAENPYDTRTYKPYTKSLRDLKNPIVTLPIWPALLLHVGGPLVAKGVAQPGEGKTQK